MQWWMWVLIGVLGCILGYFVWLGVKEKPKISCAAHVPTPTILAFGDSLVAGAGATTKGGFVSLLSRDLGIPIQNYGRSGDTTASAKERVASVVAQKPDVVIVLLGGNDALRRTPVATTQQNLDEMLATLRAGGAEIVLLGVLGGLPFKDPYPAMFKELAAKHDAAYLPNVLSGLIGKQELMSDSIHPNEAGHTRIAERVLPVLQEACAKAGPY